ncbi:MAG: WG repeat-containing protein [Propionicimonas sp.]
MLRRILPAVTLVVAALGIATPAQAVEGMPAADGKPMLWPVATRQQTVTDGRPERTTQYGFVNSQAELVVPAGYASYSYCADTDGRAVAVVASGAEGSDLLDLTGQVVAQVSYRDASCAGSDHLIVGTAVDGRWETAVVEVSTGEEVVGFRARQQIDAVAPGLVNVAGPGGEKFIELGSGRVTPHAGRVTVAALEAGAPGVPAVGRGASGSKPKLGYLSRNGTWLASPQFDAASAFRGGYAVVELNGRSTFLDAALRRVGGDWDLIRPVTVPAVIGERVVGYWVENDDLQGLLGPELQTVVQPGPSRIDCEPATGACAVTAPDGSADLVQLPKGGAATLPAGFTRAFTAGLVAERPVDQPDQTRIRSLTTGRTATLPGRAGCRGVGQWFVTCSGSVVIDGNGDRTEFTSVVEVPDPTGGIAYYRVTTAREQGFLDPDGRWRYRAPRG